MPGEIVCTFAELDLLGVALRLDVRQFPFAVPHHAVEHDQRLRLARSAQDDLASRGLIRDGGFVPELVQALTLYAKAPTSIALCGMADQDHHLALAAFDDRSAVVVVQQHESLRFTFAQPDAVVRRLVSLLPPLKPGPGTSITVTADPPETRRREQDFSELTFTATVRTAPHSPAGRRAQAVTLLQLPRLGGGDFVVTARGRTPATMSWLDTQAGRYAVLNSTDADGRLHATYTPADQAGLDRHLTHLVHSAHVAAPARKARS